MEAQQFAGKDGFIWFTGIVEGRSDPAMVGRIKVRIIGWHDENKNIVPTDALPWAQVLMPVTGQRQFSVPKEGEWVMGFFQDGANGQMPVIIGVYPGIVPNKSTTFLNQKGFGVDLNQTGATANTPGTPPVGVVGDVKSEPTTPRIARGEMQGTIVNKQNNLLNNVCDFKLDVQKNTKLKQYTKAIGDQIREAIRAIVRTLGLTDVKGNYSWIINTLKTYTRALNYIRKKIIKPIQDFAKYVLAYVTLVREMIQWILSLPEKLLQMLDACLKKLYSAVSSIFSDILVGASSESTGFDNEGWKELVNEAGNAASETQALLNDSLNTTAQIVSIPIAATAGLLNPVSEADVASANKYITEYEKSEDNKVTSPNDGMKAP